MTIMLTKTIELFPILEDLGACEDALRFATLHTGCTFEQACEEVPLLTEPREIWLSWLAWRLMTRLGGLLTEQPTGMCKLLHELTDQAYFVRTAAGDDVPATGNLATTLEQVCVAKHLAEHEFYKRSESVALIKTALIEYHDRKMQAAA